MKCPFFNCDNKEDNVNFDEPAAHVLITVGALGHIHIHAPFDDKFIMRRIVQALIDEMKIHGIEYYTGKKDKGGD